MDFTEFCPLEIAVILILQRLEPRGSVGLILSSGGLGFFSFKLD